MSAAILFFAAACKKTEPYPDNTHKCECGSLEWEGETYNLVAAHGILTDTIDFLARQYYISAEVSNDYGVNVKSINFRFTPGSTLFGQGYIDVTNPEIGTTPHLIEVIDFKNKQNPVRRYMAISGEYFINYAPFGGTEKMNWSFQVREIVNNQMVGFPKPFKGNLIVTIE
jgi:hypothetical protein